MWVVGVTGMVWGIALTDFSCLHHWVGFGPGWRQHRAAAAAGLLLPSQEALGSSASVTGEEGPGYNKSALAHFSAPGGSIVWEELVNSLVLKVNTSGSERRLQTASGCKKTCASRAHRGSDLVETCKALSSEAFNSSEIICKRQTECCEYLHLCINISWKIIFSFFPASPLLLW